MRRGRRDQEGKERSPLKYKRKKLKYTASQAFFTPHQMYMLLYYPFEEGCPIQLRTLSDEQMGQIPYMRQVLHLMTRYGSEWRHTDFYTAEYAEAFPMMADYRAYGYRVFNRLFRFIGLCEINKRDEDKGCGWGEKVTKTAVLDMMFSF